MNCPTRSRHGSYVPRFFMLLAAAILQLSCNQASEEAFSGRVIWIAIDSLRADHVGAYGYQKPTTPWLDEISQRSVRFEWALSPANHTLRSVAGYFTGVPYTMLREDAAEHGIPEETVTLAEALQSAGVRTLAYTSNAVLGAADGFEQGFDEYHYISSRGRLKSSIDEIIGAIEYGYRNSRGREFIYVHTMDVHYPYRPPAPYGDLFVTQPYAGTSVVEGTPVADDARTPATSSLSYWDPQGRVDDAAIQYLTGLYDGCIRYTDARLESLLEALDWDPETDLVIFSADHGEQLYEKFWWSHFETLTPMEIRVPLIVNYAGFDARTFDACVSLMDLYPTVLELYGVAGPENLLGRNLAPALRGGAMPEETLVYSENAPKAGLSVAVASDEYWYWLRLNRTQHEPWEIWPYEEHLYRYREDPGFAVDVLNAEPGTADALNQQLRALNPRWEAYTRDRVQPTGAVVEGENLLTEANSPVVREAGEITRAEGGWTADVPVHGLHWTAGNVERGQRYLLRIPYSLKTGKIRVALSPAEYKRPGLGQVDYVWRHELVTSSADASLLSVVVVPAENAVDLRLVFEPGTVADVGRPELRRLSADWIEPWPMPAGKWLERSDGEEMERLRSLGYM